VFVTAAQIKTESTELSTSVSIDGEYIFSVGTFGFGLSAGVVGLSFSEQKNPPPTDKKMIISKYFEKCCESGAIKPPQWCVKVRIYN
jgi:hypothetical protein